MLYTKKGDDGKTGIFVCDQRLSKSSAIAEALGTLDETNSFLGICKIRAKNDKVSVSGKTLESIIDNIQNHLFIIQAQVAGADKNINQEKINWLEELIADIEKELPEIKSFSISGGTEISSLFDFVRTLARRAERKVVEVSEENTSKIEKNTLIYLNRLSSLIFALARFSAYKYGINEQSPKY